MNVEGTANLARRAAATGVRRFVYLNSIKVNGEFTEFGLLFSADDVPAPDDPYGASKHEAEQALRWIAAGSIMSHKTVSTINARTRSNNCFTMYAADKP